MIIINNQDLGGFEKRYRTAFVNSLAGFRQAVLVGTQSVTGQANLAIFNSLIHLGADPALFGLMSRPDTVPRDTLQNILDTGEYTLNFVPSALYKQAHQTSARYPKDVSEFTAAGFTENQLPLSTAPFVAEAVVKIAMKFEEKIPIRINGTVLIIGSIVAVEMEESMIGPDGFVNLTRQQVLISQGLDNYAVAADLGRLGYAKP